jgi:ABC-type multidrug transport system ATPase subunit
MFKHLKEYLLRCRKGIVWFDWTGGAGKTSLLRILMSLLLPDSGSATMNGFDVEKDIKRS